MATPDGQIDGGGQTTIALRRSLFVCKACNGALENPKNLPCGCKCCGRCYDRSIRASSVVFTCPIADCGRACDKRVRASFLHSPRGIAGFPGGGFAKVHNHSALIEIVKMTPEKRFMPDKRFKVSHKSSLNGETQSIDKPWDVAVTSSKECFVTNGTPFVYVYDAKGTYRRRFAAITPDGTASNEMSDSALHGITVTHRGQIMVGDTTNKYVSILSPEGLHVQSVSVPIQPKFIASTTLDHVVVSACECIPAQIVDINTGREVRAIGAPTEDAGMWCPSGVCCSWDEEEIYIANQMGKAGIYSFTLEGEYLECFQSDVTVPWGIAVSDDEKYLFASSESGPGIYETDKMDRDDETSSGSEDEEEDPESRL